MQVTGGYNLTGNTGAPLEKGNNTDTILILNPVLLSQLNDECRYVTHIRKQITILFAKGLRIGNVLLKLLVNTIVYVASLLFMPVVFMFAIT